MKYLKIIIVLFCLGHVAANSMEQCDETIECLWFGCQKFIPKNKKTSHLYSHFTYTCPLCENENKFFKGLYKLRYHLKTDHKKHTGKTRELRLWVKEILTKKYKDFLQDFLLTIKQEFQSQLRDCYKLDSTKALQLDQLIELKHVKPTLEGSWQNLIAKLGLTNSPSIKIHRFSSIEVSGDELDASDVFEPISIGAEYLSSTQEIEKNALQECKYFDCSQEATDLARQDWEKIPLCIGIYTIPLSGNLVGNDLQDTKPDELTSNQCIDESTESIYGLIAVSPNDLSSGKAAEKQMLKELKYFWRALDHPNAQILKTDEDQLLDKDEDRIAGYLIPRIFNEKFSEWLELVRKIENNEDSWKKIIEEAELAESKSQQNSLKLAIYGLNEPELPKNRERESQLSGRKIGLLKHGKQLHKNPKRRKVTKAAIQVIQIDTPPISTPQPLSETDESIHEVPQGIRSSRQKKVAEESPDFTYEELKDTSPSIKKQASTIQLN